MTTTLDDFMTEPDAPSVQKVGAKWTFDPDQRTRIDWTPHLAQNLLVSLELEYNFKRGVETTGHDYMGREERHNTFDTVSVDEVGVSYATGNCPVCDQYGCWKCDLPKTIRMIKSDCTIHGREFIVIGSNYSAEEFVKRLPLENIMKYFEPCHQDSMHSHVLIPDYNQNIPVAIGQNVWQLFRVYYPAWAYIFGNRKGSILRGSWAKWNDYGEDAKDFDHWWNGNNIERNPASTPRTIARRFKQGLTFASSDANETDKVFSHFDVEIRQTDASQDPEQIVAARSLSKALVLKAAQLANQGVLGIPEDRWAAIQPVIQDINRSLQSSSWEPMDFKLERRQGATMLKMAKEFYAEMRDLLTPFERRCVRHCIMNPVRKRNPNHLGVYGEPD